MAQVPKDKSSPGLERGVGQVDGFGGGRAIPQDCGLFVIW